MTDKNPRQPRSPRVRIVDVAKRAGVSRTTASYILCRREPYFSRYSAKTIERVVRAADEMGYRRNRLAASLRLSQSPFVGAYFDLDPAVPGPRVKGLPRHLWDVFAGITHVAVERGVYPVLIARARREDIAAEARRLAQVGGIPLRGMLVFAGAPLWERVFQEWDRTRTPCVGVLCSELAHAPGWGVDVDHAAAGAAAAEHLLGRGARRLVCVGDCRDTPAVRQRLEGFRGRLERESRPVELHVVDVALSADGEKCDGPEDYGRLYQRVLRELAALRPDGVFAATGPSAAAAEQALRNLGCDPSGDCPLVAIVDQPDELLARGVVQVCCPGYEIGCQAATLLFERLDGRLTQPLTRRLAPRIYRPPRLS